MWPCAKPRGRVPSSLAGRQIVLAGGAGGLGSATTHLLAEEGTRLLVSYHSQAERAAALGQIAALTQADITREVDRTRLLAQAPELYGLVVLAGTPARPRPSETDEQRARRSQEENYLGPLLLARAAADQMWQAGTPGAIILFSTMQAEAVFAGSSFYAAPKAALTHAALVLAKECRGANIRVNVIAPGVMQAGMAQESIAAGKYARYREDGSIPRYGTATDVARAVRFLLEPDNYITGQVLRVDGGLSL